jgi:DNA (cytosine-5)-methyltransferase 1
MRVGSLFSGIGGLELGLEWAGVGHTVWQVEQNEYCRSVLARHWPEARRYEDVCKVGRRELEPVDVICGGFPCQDLSAANATRKGLAGSRSGLWLEFARIIDELRPRWVVVENVSSGAAKWVDPVSADLGELGYETLPLPLAADALGAPHRRARVFLVARRADADAHGPQHEGDRSPGRVQAQEPDAGQLGARGPATRPRPWASAPQLQRVDDGTANRLDRLRACGNAVVPQCAEVVGHVLLELERRAGR